MKETDRKIREIICLIVDDEREKVVYELENPDLIKDLMFDSVDIVQFIVMIEEQFGVDFNEEGNVDIIWDFRRLCEWLEKKIGLQ